MQRPFVLFLLVLFTTLLPGCGMFAYSPRIPRMSAEVQAQYESMWKELLSPVEKADRDTLLATTAFFQMYLNGIDKAEFTAEKQVGDKRVRMKIRFRRLEPDDDRYTVTVLNQWGWPLREEHYTSAELAAYEEAMQPIRRMKDQPPTPQEEFQQKRMEQRIQAITAATQPAPG